MPPFTGAVTGGVPSSVVPLEVAGPPLTFLLGLALVGAIFGGGIVGGGAALLTLPLVSRGWGRLLPGLLRHDDREWLRHLVVGVMLGVVYAVLGPVAWWLVVPATLRRVLGAVHVLAPLVFGAAMAACLLGGAILLGRPLVAASRGSDVADRTPISRVERAYLAGLFGLPVLVALAVSFVAFLGSYL